MRAATLAIGLALSAITSQANAAYFWLGYGSYSNDASHKNHQFVVAALPRNNDPVDILDYIAQIPSELFIDGKLRGVSLITYLGSENIVSNYEVSDYPLYELRFPTDYDAGRFQTPDQIFSHATADPTANTFRAILDPHYTELTGKVSAAGYIPGSDFSLTSPVPETSTWAMLMLGLALVGLRLRLGARGVGPVRPLAAG